MGKGIFLKFPRRGNPSLPTVLARIERLPRAFCDVGRAQYTARGLRDDPRKFYGDTVCAPTRPVTTRGLNIVHESLLAGVPLIVVPRQIEQVVNAHRLCAFNAGMIAHDPTADTRITSLNTILNQRDMYRQAIEPLRHSLQDARGRCARLMNCSPLCLGRDLSRKYFMLV